MNVLQVNKFHWLKGGSESVYLGLSQLLRSHGHNVISFSMKDERNLPSEWERFFVENVDYESASLSQKLLAASKILYSFDAKNKMRALLRDVDPAVAHFHIFQHQISPSVFGPLRDRRIPIVLTLHDLKPICPNYKMLVNGNVCEMCKGGRFYNCFLNRCSKGSAAKSLIAVLEMYLHHALGYYRSVDRYIAVSDFYRRKMIEFGFPAGQIVHIPNSIDPSLFPLSHQDEGFGLYFGRLSEEKGVDTLLHALAKCPTVPFRVVGTGPLEAELKQLSSELGLSKVEFCGFKKGDELQKLLGAASFTVIPSQWYENCPMSVLESFSMGKPVIGSRIGGIPELIADGVDGYIFEPGKVDELAEKIQVLWDAPQRRRKMGLEGRTKVETEYSPERYYDKILSAYNDLANS